MLLQAGDRVAGKYRIERLLGEGGMGAVFVAENERLRKRVALKILRREIANVRGAAERFTREAIAASSAKHPGIIEIYDADVHDGMPWIAMELLEGESVADRMERGRIPLPEVLEIACEALAALAHVHRAGIIHRDLKPDNLFLERLPDGGRRVKILDFGIAASSHSELARVTQTGMAIGTPAYLAPEQAAGQSDIDARVDVYAMGVILFELITGRLPYEAGSLGEMVMRMYTVGPPSLATHGPHLPPALCALVDMCLALDRDARVQSAETLRRELESVRPLARALSVPPTHEVPAARDGVDGVATPPGHPSFSNRRADEPLGFAATMGVPSPPGAVPLTSFQPTPPGHPHWTPTGQGAYTPPSMRPGPSSTPVGESSPAQSWGWTPASPPAVPASAPQAPRGSRLGLIGLILGGGLLLGLLGTAVAAGTLVILTRRDAARTTLAAPPGVQPVVPVLAAPVPAPAPPALPPALPPAAPAPAAPTEPLAVAAPAEPVEPREAPPRSAPPSAPTSTPPSAPSTSPSTPRGARAPRPRVEPPVAAHPAAASVPAPPSPRPVASSEPRPLDTATVLRVLNTHEARLDRCYFDAYPELPRPRVRVEVDLTIATSGGVTQARVTGGRPQLAACLERVLSSIRFPTHPHSSHVRFPMTLFDNP